MSSLVEPKRPIRLAIVGASVRAAAESAIRAGFEVVGADLFADADLDHVGSITRIDDYPKDLADWLVTQSADAWLYTGALENYAELIDQMAMIAPLWGVSGDALRRCRDPLELQDVFAQAGISFPATRRDLSSLSSNESWLAKTYRHSSGLGVRRLATTDDRQWAKKGNAYAQAIVEGQPVAALFAIGRERATLLGVTEQVLGGWAYRGSTGPVAISPPITKTLARLGECLAGDLGLRGLIGVDFLSQGDRLTVIEINPRYTASAEVLERATGGSAIQAHAATFLNEAIEPWGPARQVVSKRIEYATERLVITADVDAAMQRDQAAGRLADRPRLGEVIEAGQPICTRFDVDVGRSKR